MFDLNINLEFLQHCPTFKKSSSRLYWYKRINFIWPKSVHKMPPCDIKLEKSQTFVCQCSLFSCSHKNFFKFIYIIENRSTKFNIILSLCIWCISVHLTYIDCNNFSMIARTSDRSSNISLTVDYHNSIEIELSVIYNLVYLL